MPQDVYIYNPIIPVPKYIRHAEIPEGITVIREDAFRRCSRLQSVVIPDSVTEIGAGAFYDCSALRSVTIPDSVTKIGRQAFYNCYGLQSLTISDGVTEIGERTFYGCNLLQSVTIPGGITEIPKAAFWGCSGLQSVTIPDGVTKIGVAAFGECSGLRSVTIPKSVTGIEEYAFKRCDSLRSVTISDGVIKIHNNAFAECRELKSVTIPDSVTEIGSSAFYGCRRLQSVILPNGITKINDSAFDYCRLLQSVTIPKSVTVIGNNAFHECSCLQSVEIPDGVNKIGKYAFWRCPDLQSIAIPGSVTEIDDFAFWGCSGLQSVTISDGVTEIGVWAFGQCSDLQSVAIPDSVTDIGPDAFCGCSALQRVIIPDRIKIIGNNAFKDCPRLQSLMFKGVNIAPFINVNGYGANTFNVIRTLIEHEVPLTADTLRQGIRMQHQDELSQWAREYSVFGEMRLSAAMKSVDGKTEERLRQCFTAQKRTKGHVPGILDRLVITACTCGIPSERLAKTFDIEYTQNLLDKKIPLVPAEACRCYYDRNICNTLIQKNKISVMAEAIAFYNRSGHRECYKHLMEFILSHSDTKTEDLQYAVSHAAEIPMNAETTLAQVRRHSAYTESLAEVTKIETEYRKEIPGFSLSDYPCNLDPTGITYDGMTARILDLSDEKDTALAATLGDLTNCCQRFEDTGETAMMHGFLNPDAGFWVIQDANGTVKAQAEIWEADGGILVFDNIEFADTDNAHLPDRVEQLRGVIAAWAMGSGYTNIIMGCGYNELGAGFMKQAPIPELRLTPEEVFALQKGNDAGVSFRNIDEARRYMLTEEYDSADFVYTDADDQCVYIKKDGIVSDYLMRGYDERSAGNRNTHRKNLSTGEHGNIFL